MLVEKGYVRLFFNKISLPSVHFLERTLYSVCILTWLHNYHIIMVPKHCRCIAGTLPACAYHYMYTAHSMQ